VRVLQAMAGRKEGGAERFFARLVIALDNAGIKQHVLIRNSAACAGWLRQGGMSAVELPFGGRLDLLTARRFRKEIEQFKPQVVLTWMNKATRFCPKPNGFIHVGRLGGYYNLKYYRSCHHLVANTSDIVDYVNKMGWKKSIHYLPNFAHAIPAKPASRRALDTPEHAPLVLSLGRLHHNKGFDVLLRAMMHVPEAYLWIAGTGPLENELFHSVNELGLVGRVRFLGWRDDVAALHAAADVYVCPSRHEPLGNVIIEAWAQGKPVVSAASKGPAELITNEESGLLVQVDDVIGLSDAIRRVFTDKTLADRLATGGFRAYENEFTESIVVGRYISFLKKLA